jgi:hypothetical protein
MTSPTTSEMMWSGKYEIVGRQLVNAVRMAQNRAMRPPYPVPSRIGPVEFGALGGWITVLCPRDHDSLMRSAGGQWEPGSRRWLIGCRRIGPVIRTLERWSVASIHSFASPA